jgi:hypothetical protein
LGIGIDGQSSRNDAANTSTLFQIWNSNGVAGFFCFGNRGADDNAKNLDYDYRAIPGRALERDH